MPCACDPFPFSVYLSAAYARPHGRVELRVTRALLRSPDRYLVCAASSDWCSTVREPLSEPGTEHDGYDVPVLMAGGGMTRLDWRSRALLFVEYV